MCTSTSMGSFAVLMAPDAVRYLKPAQRRKCCVQCLPNLRVMPCCSATLLKMGCITLAEIGTPALPTRSHLSRRMGMSTSQASRCWRPSFLLSCRPSSNSPRRQPRTEEHVRKPGRQVLRDRLVVPSLQEAQLCVVDHPVPQFSVMAGGRCASASRAPAWRRPLLHPARGTSSRRATCPGATSLAAPSAARSREAPRAWPQSHAGPRVYCSSMLGFPTRLFFATCGHSNPSLVAALCLTRARKSSSACRSRPRQSVVGGPARRVK